MPAPEPDFAVIPPVLGARLAALRAEMWAEFERVTAYIDCSDPDQCALAKSELDRILAEAKVKLEDMLIKATLDCFVSGPLTKMLGIDLAPQSPGREQGDD